MEGRLGKFKEILDFSHQQLSKTMEAQARELVELRAQMHVLQGGVQEVQSALGREISVTAHQGQDLSVLQNGLAELQLGVQRAESVFGQAMAKTSEIQTQVKREICQRKKEENFPSATPLVVMPSLSSTFLLHTPRWSLLPRFRCQRRTLNPRGPC